MRQLSNLRTLTKLAQAFLVGQSLFYTADHRVNNPRLKSKALWCCMANHTTYIRRVYRRPGWDRSPTHPGKVRRSRRPPKATRRSKEAFWRCRHQRPARTLRSGCCWILSKRQLTAVQCSRWAPVCKTQFLPGQSHLKNTTC
jgi:hypothetical protein